jgi:hypothetical protein
VGSPTDALAPLTQRHGHQATIYSSVLARDRAAGAGPGGIQRPRPSLRLEAVPAREGARRHPAKADALTDAHLARLH